jgi:hypothetical protein
MFARESIQSFWKAATWSKYFSILSLIEGFCHGIGQSAAKTVERRPPAAKDVDSF